MKALKCLPFVSFLFLVNMLTASPKMAAQEPTHQSVGLVLSGGGAKGIAHVGAIKALEENNIPIDYITGTSMGAIIGGLYACGYTPEEMMALLTSPYFGYISQGKIDPDYTYYFSSEAPSPQMFSFSPGKTKPKTEQRFNPQSLISPKPMSFGFMEFFAAYTAQCRGDFDRLFVPLRTVASDMTHRRAHVFRGGRLSDAIRASMSFPLVFQAIELDSIICYDGGIYDNFPVDVMRSEFAPSIMVGIDVSAESDKIPNSFMDQLDLLVMRPQTYALPADEGIKVRVNLSDFGLLDWGAAEEIYERGYRRTLEMIDSIKARVHTRITPEARELRRAVFKSNTPALRFESVDVTGCTPRQNDYLRYLFHPAKGCDTIGIDRARQAYYRAIASDKLEIFAPKATFANDTSDLFRLDISGAVKSNFSIGLGAYITSSNNSMLYARARYSSLSFSSINANAEAWIGQSYMAGVLSGTIFLPTPVPSSLKLEAVAWRKRFYENEQLFFRDNEPSFVVKHEYFGKLSWRMAAGRRAAIDVGIGGGRLYDSFFRNDIAESYLAGRDHSALNLGQVYVGLSTNSLDEQNYPCEGSMRRIKGAAVTGRRHYYNALAPEGERNIDGNISWIELRWRERDYFRLGRHWSLGVEGELVASTHRLLPRYYASISQASAYEPTPASANVFDPKMRANSFIAAGVVPVWRVTESLSARLSLNAFAPFRAIAEGPDGTARYGRWFGSMQFFGEFDVVYRLPFASIAGYCNYASGRGGFNAGISFGLYIPAPRFL